MATYSLAPSPKWYFADAAGRPAAGGILTTWMSSDHSTPKFVYSDASGLHPYMDPIVLDASGGASVPLYWDVTTAGLYYIVVKDGNGNIIFDLDNYPIIGGGGVTPITTNIDIENHIVNGAFLFIDAVNAAASVISPAPAETRIAPASGLFKDSVGQYVPDLFNNLSGWIFGKAGGAGETSSIEFVDVPNLGEGPPLAPTGNATRFFRYTLNVAGAAQTEVTLFQTIPGVETFQNEGITVSFDTNSTTAGNGIFEVVQYYGSAPASPTTTSVPRVFSFSSGAWARQSFPVSVPSTLGKVKGPNNDDSVQIRFYFPANVIGSFEITNIQVQRGNFVTPSYIYQDYNQDQYKVLIDLIVNGNLSGFRTGDYVWSDNGSTAAPTARPGWLLLWNDAQELGKTIASGAQHYGTQYQNLYVLWWESFNQARCIVNGGRGGSALADFNADKRMTIPRDTVNYVFAVAGNAIPFGTFEGEREHLLTIPEIPAHHHTYDIPNVGVANGFDAFGLTVGSPANTGDTGGGLAHNNMPPTTYKYLFVKL